LYTRPFDAVVKILRLLWTPERHVPGGGTSPTGVDTDAYVALWDPFLRINDFPVLVLVGGVGCDIRMLFRHDIPGGLVAILKGEALSIGAITHDDRVLAWLDGPKDIGEKFKAITGGNADIPINTHALAGLRSGDVTHSETVLLSVS
jgi:hypothetical protein